MLTIEPRVVTIFCTPSPISFEHMSSWCAFLHPRLTTNHSHTIVQFRKNNHSHGMKAFFALPHGLRCSYEQTRSQPKEMATNQASPTLVWRLVNGVHGSYVVILPSRTLILKWHVHLNYAGLPGLVVLWFLSCNWIYDLCPKKIYIYIY